LLCVRNVREFELNRVKRGREVGGGGGGGRGVNMR